MSNLPYYTKDEYENIASKLPSKDFPSFMQITFGGVTRRVGFCEIPVVDIKTGAKRIPTIAEQAFLVGSAYKEHLGRGSAADTEKFLSRSTVVTPNGEFQLSELYKHSNGVNLDSTIKHGFERIGVTVPPKSLEFKKIATIMGKASFSMMNHTASLETVYLMANNPHAVQHFTDFVADSERSILHYGDTRTPTVAGMLGHAENGVKTVVLGKETKSPQGFVQGVSIYTGMIASNALNSENDMITARAYGESLIGAISALKELNEQVPENTVMPFIKQVSVGHVIESVNELKHNAAVQTEQQYNYAKNGLMYDIGSSYMEDDFTRIATRITDNAAEVDNTAVQAETPAP